MKTKKVEKVFSPTALHMVGDGFRVFNFIPSYPELSMQRMSPFIMLDYNSKFYFPPSENPRGVGAHPHKGFETVTIAYKGSVAHNDSAGHSGVISEGDVQWMTAASGILHKEFHEKEFSKKGGDFQMVQLWVNLTAKDKKSKPKYQDITHEKVGKYNLPDDSGIIEIIAGEYDGIKGGASTFTPIHLMNAKLNKGGKAKFSFPENYNTALLVISGSIKVNDSENIDIDHFVLFENEGEAFEIEAMEAETAVLIMSGEPIKEAIAAHGPFVMNTKQELMEAFEEFNTGKFGYLE